MTNFIRHKNLTKVDALIFKKSLRHSVDKHLPAICPFYYKVTVQWLSRLLQCSTYQWTAWPATSCGAHQDSNPPRIVVVKSGVVFNQSSQCLKWPHGTCVVCRLLLLPCGVINDDLLQRVPMEVSAKQWDDNVWIKLSEWRQKTASDVIVHRQCLQVLFVPRSRPCFLTRKARLSTVVSLTGGTAWIEATYVLELAASEDWSTRQWYGRSVTDGRWVVLLH